MIRNLKALGVAMAAVFAMSAVMASAASAQQAYLTADTALAGIDGKDIGAASANRLTAFSTYTQCSEVNYSGSILGESSDHGTTATAIPDYKGCKSSALGFGTTVAMNDCHYIFHLGETTGEGDTYGVQSTLICEGEGNPEVTINVFGSHCTITITPSEAGYSGLHATDTTEGDIVLNGTVEGIKAHATGNCPETGTTENAKLDTNVTVTGDPEVGEGAELGISELGHSTAFINTTAEEDAA